jgi:hypothetical protein
MRKGRPLELVRNRAFRNARLTEVSWSSSGGMLESSLTGLMMDTIPCPNQALIRPEQARCRD